MLKPLFSFVFGAKWYSAGLYARWLAVAWFFGFINVPSVMLIPIVGLQNKFLIYESALFLFRALSIPIGAYIGDVFTAIALYSFVGATFNFLLMCFMFSVTINSKKALALKKA